MKKKTIMLGTGDTAYAEVSVEASAERRWPVSFEIHHMAWTVERVGVVMTIAETREVIRALKKAVRKVEEAQSWSKIVDEH